MLMDDLISKVRDSFASVPEHRNTTKGNIQYSLVDCLTMAYSMFVLKDPSLAVYRTEYPNRAANLKRVFGLESIPKDTAMRETLDGVDYTHLEDVFKPCLDILHTEKVFENRLVLGGYLACSNDGTGIYCSGKKNCKHCLTKTLKNGDTLYHHQLLASVNVHPKEKEVFPIAVVPIMNEDGSEKNDCELNASKRLLPQINRMLPDYKILGLFDALYANGPHIKTLKSENMSYIIGIKSGHVQEYIRDLKSVDGLIKKIWTSKGKRCVAAYYNKVTLNMQHPDIEVNYFEYTETDLKTGKITFYSSWITDIEITQENIKELVEVARTRWKIENETFNTLKNQGYHLEHNYGHGKYNLATNFAILTFLAFLTDQIAQYLDTFFKKAWKTRGSKTGLWSKIRAIFDLLPVASMNAIYKFISEKQLLDIPLLE
jgi:hypothetical protein